MPFSQTGLWMRNTANAWQVFEISESPALLGLTFLFQGLPALIMGLFGGTLADMIDRRKLMLVTQSLQVVVAVLLGILTFFGEIQVWHIYALTFAASTLASAEGPARMALIPSLVPRSHLLNATALQSVATQTSFMLGPLLAGIAISASTPATAYFVNAALMAPAMVAVAMLRVRREAGAQKIQLNVRAIFEGLIFAIQSRVLIAFLVLDTVTMVLGYYPAMMPVFAKEILRVGPIGLGALLAAPAFGSVFGFLVILMLGNVRSKGALILVVTVLHAVVLLLFAFSPWFLVSLLLVALLGLLDSMSVSVRQTSFQLLAPEEVRGRVVSLVQIFARGSNSFGGAYLGLASSLMGARLALGTGGAIAGAVALLIAARWRQVREFKA